MVHRQNNLREKIIIEQFISGITEGKPMLQLVDCLLDHINLKNIRIWKEKEILMK